LEIGHREDNAVAYVGVSATEPGLLEAMLAGDDWRAEGMLKKECKLDWWLIGSGFVGRDAVSA
jgi:hypothetical protein